MPAPAGQVPGSVSSMTVPTLSVTNAMRCPISGISMGPPISGTSSSSSRDTAASRSATARQKWCSRDGSMLVRTLLVGASPRFDAPASSSILTSPAVRRANVVSWDSNRWSTVKPKLREYHAMVVSRSSWVTVMPTWSWENVKVMSARISRRLDGNQRGEFGRKTATTFGFSAGARIGLMTADIAKLGPMLRTWRGRLSPAAAGLPAGRGRRVSGLRREDLAELAGISVDYVVRLEQGRYVTPSAQVAGALARALQLTDAAGDHLYRLAGRAGLAAWARGEISDHIPPGLSRMLNRLGDAAAAVFAADWQLIWWNRGWAGLLGDPSATPSALRNFARDTFPVDGGTPRLSHWPVT